MKFQKVTLVGTGFMAGCIARDLKAEKLAEAVWAVPSSKKRIPAVMKTRLFDRVSVEIKEACKDSDIVILCCPPDAIISYLKILPQYISSQTAVTDIGSIKYNIYKIGRKYLPENFSGCHPLCGSEAKGIKNSRNSLFKDALCIMTPFKRNKPYKIIKSFWQSLGSRVETMSPEKHDEVLAYVSHFPHLISFLFMQIVPLELLRYTAGSFRDLTRVAASDPGLWQEIFFSNKGNIRKVSRKFTRNLAKVLENISSGRKEVVKNILRESSAKREKLYDNCY